jgi:hypothetical protein
MNNVSAVVESEFKVLASQFLSLMQTASNIVKNYNSTNVVTLVTGAASQSTPVTVSTSLTQYQFESGITFCTQLQNFFNGSAVVTADYLGIVENLITGTTPAAAILSNGVESIGSQLQQLGQNVLTYYNGAVIANAAYNQNGLAQTVSAISASTIVPGASHPAADFSSAITMVLQFINLMTNQAVFASNYFNTCIEWTQGPTIG